MTRKAARIAMAAALCSALVSGGCGMDRADQEVIDRLVALPILDVPAGATLLDRSTSKGGGSDLVDLRGASSATVVWATGADPEEVAAQFHDDFDSTWTLHDNGAAPVGDWAAIGALASDPGTIATIEARRPTPADDAPGGTLSVVTVSVSATRE